MKSKVRSKAIYRLVGAEQGNKLPYYERAGRKVFAVVVKEPDPILHSKI